MNTESSEHLDLRRLLSALRRKWAWILILTALVGSAAFGYTSSKPKEYDASAIMITGAGKGLGNLELSSQVNDTTQTLGDLIDDRVVVDRALSKVKNSGKVDIDELLKKVSSNVPPDTQEILLTVRDEDPKRARDIANAIVTEFSKLVKEKAGNGSELSATVWQQATVPKHAAVPRVKLMTAVGLFLGLLLGMIAAIAHEYFDSRWRGEDDIERYLDLPVLGLIPDFSTPAARLRRYA